MTLRFVLFGATLAVAAGIACGDSGDATGPPPPVTRNYQPLTTRTAVLSNLELAIIRRDIVEIDKLLDKDFTFHLSDYDVMSGGLPPQWDRATEIEVNTHLFSQIEDPMGRWPLCTSILFDLDLSNPDWVDIVPPPVADETWSMVTVFYDFQIEMMPDVAFIPAPGSQVRCTVRNTGTDADPQWRLAEAADLGTGVASDRITNAVGSATWGNLKALYRSEK